jgi:hypothetical protein
MKPRAGVALGLLAAAGVAGLYRDRQTRWEIAAVGRLPACDPHRAHALGQDGRGRHPGAFLTYQGSIVALDIKGELYAATRGWRATQGQRILCGRPMPKTGAGTGSTRCNVYRRVRICVPIKSSQSRHRCTRKIPTRTRSGLIRRAMRSSASPRSCTNVGITIYRYCVGAACHRDAGQTRTRRPGFPASNGCSGCARATGATRKASCVD